MIKKELKLKKLSTKDIGNIVETISDYIVGINENGTVYYMPYIKENALAIALTLYAIEGLQFEKDDKIYDIYIEDEDINALVKLFINDNVKLMSKIEKNVDDVVKFKKDYIIHNNPIFTNKIMEILKIQKTYEDYRYELAKKENKILEQQIDVNNYQLEIMKHLTPEEIAEIDKKLISGELENNIGLESKKNVIQIENKKKSSPARKKKTTKKDDITESK